MVAIAPQYSPSEHVLPLANDSVTMEAGMASARQNLEARLVTDAMRIRSARRLFNRYLTLLRAYNIAAYDLFADDAEITSTRRNIMTLRWSAKKYRTLIGPSVQAAREAGRTYAL